MMGYNPSGSSNSQVAKHSKYRGPKGGLKETNGKESVMGKGQEKDQYRQKIRKINL